MLEELLNNYEYLIAGFVAFGTALVYWTRSRREQRQEESSVEERIKKLFKEEIELLNGKISYLVETTDKQKAEIEILKKTQLELQKANELLTKIFQGRDDDSLEYRKSGREAMREVKEIIPIIVETNGNTKVIIEQIKELLEVFNKHLENIENMEIEKVTETTTRRPNKTGQ